jgi:predicted HTH transcriptional regulator
VVNSASYTPHTDPRTLFHSILVQLLGQPVEVVENEELEIKGWCKDEKEFAEKMVESACCIANAHGGAVLGGIESKRTTFSPCPHRNVNVAWIEKRIKDHSYPPVECEVFDLTEMLTEIRGMAGGNVFGLVIPRKKFLTSHVTTRGISKIRQGKECKPYFTAADDDRTRAVHHEASTNDLSLDSMKWAIARHQKKFNVPPTDETPLDFLARMRLIVPPHDGMDDRTRYDVTLAALILFGKEKALEQLNPSFETIVSFGNERQRLQRNIVECIRELMIAEKSPLRQRCSSMADEMLFELLMNAYIHRCWRTPGPIMIRIDDILEIQSPGELMPGLNVTNLLHCIPSYRNFLLAESCRHIGLCDKLGKGIGLVFDSALKGGLDIPIFESADNTFTVRQSLTQSENFREFVRVRASSLSNRDEILALRALLDRDDMAVTEIAQVLQRGIEYTNTVLTSMERKRMVERRRTDRFSLDYCVRSDIENIYRKDQLDMFHDRC